jgi:hypothetical protein
MTWKTVFQIYQKPEKEKKEKVVIDNRQQVSQFTLFLPCEGIKKSADMSAQNILDHIDMKKLKAFLGEDWDDYKDDPESLALWAYLLFKNHLIDRGIAPANFTATTWCNLCGYVYVPPELTNGGNVLGCPWCWNRVKGLTIPKPITCSGNQRNNL